MNKNARKFKFRDVEFPEHEIFEDEEDRQRVLAMNELERETVIADRVERLMKKRERANLLKQKSDVTNTKRDALKAIKNKRTMRRNQESQKGNGDNVSSFSSDSESGEVDDESGSKSDSDYSSDDDYSGDSRKQGKKNRAKVKRSRSNSSSSFSGLSEISEDISKQKEKFTLSINDVEKARLSRTFITKYWELPVFDQKAKGCFVKINITAKATSNNTGYLLGQVKDIIENKEKPYTLENKQCSKYLLVTHGLQEKPIGFNIVSNSPLTEIEFRVWKDRMEKYNIELPTMEKIRICVQNIEDIKNYQLSNEEFRRMMEKKKDLKIKHLDKNMNITYELTLLTDEYNSAKQKYEELNDKSYLVRMEELAPKIENLKKMHQEREREELKRSEADRVAQINKKNLEKQKLNDLRNSMINRKLKRDEIVNPYKRRDCKPINLYDSGYLKKNDISKNDKDESHEKNEAELKHNSEASGLDVDIHFTPQKFYKIKKQNLEQIQNAFKNLSNELDELYHKKKQHNGLENKDESDFSFRDLGLDKNLLPDLVTNHNSKIQKDKAKVISLNDLEY